MAITSSFRGTSTALLFITDAWPWLLVLCINVCIAVGALYLPESFTRHSLGSILSNERILGALTTCTFTLTTLYFYNAKVGHKGFCLALARLMWTIDTCDVEFEVANIDLPALLQEGEQLDLRTSMASVLRGTGATGCCGMPSGWTEVSTQEDTDQRSKCERGEPEAAQRASVQESAREEGSTGTQDSEGDGEQDRPSLCSRMGSTVVGWFRVHNDNPGMQALTLSSVAMGAKPGALCIYMMMICRSDLSLTSTAHVSWEFLKRVVDKIPHPHRDGALLDAISIREHMFSPANEVTRVISANFILVYFTVLPLFVSIMFGAWGIVVGVVAAYLVLVPFVAAQQLHLPFHHVHGAVDWADPSVKSALAATSAEWRALKEVVVRVVDIIPFGGVLTTFVVQTKCWRRRQARGVVSAHQRRATLFSEIHAH